MLARAIVEQHGKLVYVAHELGYARSRIYALVHEHKLWRVVNKVRADRIQREKQEKKRRQ
jgi:hypothetical protein